MIYKMIYRAQLLRQHINTLVKDTDVFPICVPSYNRPNAPVLRYVDIIPITLFIRREQEELYKDYKDKCNIVLLDNVTEIGTTRKAIVDWAISKGYSDIFMMDDDISCTDYLLPSVSSTSSNEFMRLNKTIQGKPYSIDFQFFKMWVWLIGRCSSKLTISAPGAKSDWWNIRYKNSKTLYNSGSTIQLIHLNIDNLVKAGINYVDTNIGGTEDYTLQYQVMAAGLYTCIFKDLVYCVPGVGSGSGGNTNNEELIQKYQRFIKLFQDNILQDQDKNKVTTKVSKGGIPSIKFNWNRWKSDEFMMYGVDDIYNEVELKEKINGNL